MKSVSEIGRIFYYRVSDLLSEESERQALWLPVAFACGIGVYFSLSFEPPFFLTLQPQQPGYSFPVRIIYKAAKNGRIVDEIYPGRGFGRGTRTGGTLD